MVETRDPNKLVYRGWFPGTMDNVEMSRVYGEPRCYRTPPTVVVTHGLRTRSRVRSFARVWLWHQ